MRLSKYWMLLASLVLVACGDENGSSDTQSSKAQPKTDCTISYGWESRKPYQFYENKKMRGIDVEILEQAAGKAGCQLNFVEKSWADLLEAVEKGTVDVLAGATPTEDRKQFADFSVPYREEAFALFIANSNSFSGDDLAQFVSFGNKIGVSSGYFYGGDVEILMQHPQYKSMFVGSTTNEASFYNVEYGRVHGVLVDPIEGRYIMKRRGFESKMKESKIKIPADSVAYMFSKKSKKLEKLNEIKMGVEQLVAAQTPQKVIAKYQ
ncbi:ABC transporter substrate-binding protein [Kangiella sp. TOML190]|uniref:substrate-binding periplasmic protein n=1 Tax=Kangiella sp. TOML190 TaxID=2931351 RepID=UPI0020417288|nr:transporter substrate-binding domain-containing protein [Kangiella sp. TOML190]